MSLPLADAVRGMIHVLGDAEWEADARKIADNIAKLERENAALRAELAPLRETVGVRGDSKTCRDDINYWSKLVERSDFAIRLERENAALRVELEAQAVVNGKGGEREAKLLAEVAALRKALEEALAESDDTVRFHMIRNAVEALKEAQP